MKKVIRLTESDLVKIIEQVISEQPKEVNEIWGLLSKGSKYLKPSLIGKTKVNTLTKELGNFIPKEYLTNQKEISAMVSRLNKLGTEVNSINGNYIKKFGSAEYNNLIRRYLYGHIDKKSLITQLKNVKNPNIKLKPVLGYGADHEVYESVTHPDKVFKIELRPGEVDKWYNVFNSHPELYAKTFKKLKVKGKNNQMLNAVIMEKLNVGPFHKLWDKMESLLYESQKKLPVNERTGLERLAKRRSQPLYDKQWNDFLKFLKTKNDPSSQKINEFLSLVNKLYKVTPNPDIRKFNFGYDKSGVLKSLDL